MAGIARWLRRRPLDDAPYVVVRPTGGLGNRLKAVVSSRALAEHLGLRFAAVWQAGPGFSSDGWNDLFANEVELMDRADFEALLDAGICRVDLRPEVVPDQRNPAIRGFEPRSALRDFRRLGVAYDGAAYHLDTMLERLGVRVPRRIVRRRNGLYPSLRPTAALATRIGEFEREHFTGRYVIGVHIRRGDAWSGPHYRGYAESTDAAFEAAMRAVGQRRPDVRFFLATDDADTLARFQERFGAQILSFEKTFVPSVYGEEKRGIQDATVEFFLLSRTRRIIGTRYSTFGRIAARVGGLRFDPALEG